MTQQSYAYAVTVGSRKRFGGVVHAASMEAAAKRAAKHCGLSISRHGPIDPPLVDWTLDGKRAFLYVYAPPETF